MKKIHKLMLASSAVLPVFAAGGVLVSAATDTTKPESSLVQKIATKFNLNSSDVQAVFDEEHAERKAERDQAYQDKLTEAVSSGDLTQEQADTISAKRTELEAQREANKDSWSNLTPEERRTKMQEQRDALKAWADENNIELKWLHLGGIGMGGHGMGMRDEPSEMNPTQE